MKCERQEIRFALSVCGDKGFPFSQDEYVSKRMKDENTNKELKGRKKTRRRRDHMISKDRRGEWRM